MVTLVTQDPAAQLIAYLPPHSKSFFDQVEVREAPHLGQGHPHED